MGVSGERGNGLVESGEIEGRALFQSKATTAVQLGKGFRRVGIYGCALRNEDWPYEGVGGIQVNSAATGENERVVESARVPYNGTVYVDRPASGKGEFSVSIGDGIPEG